MSDYRMRRADYYLMILAYLGPMTGKEVWDCLFGCIAHCGNGYIKRTLGVLPRDAWDDLNELRKLGKVYVLSRNLGNREVVWAATI